jgi:hypothetical protein
MVSTKYTTPEVLYSEKNKADRHLDRHDISVRMRPAENDKQ